MTAETLALCGFAFLAGLIDSVVGGGGLVQIPALLILLPHDTPVADVFGTNKCVSVTGTAAAAWSYARHVPIDWRVILPTTAAGFIFSVFGAMTVSHLNPAALRPLALVMLVTVAVYTYVRKDFGSLHAPHLELGAARWIGAGVGAILGFYDGFFGPGTGSFLIFTFIGVFGFGFLAASASSKVVNTATNLSTVIYFVLTGHVYYWLAVPMAVCNVAGSFVGTRLAILRGNKFVRWFFLAVVTAIIGRLAYDILRGD